MDQLLEDLQNKAIVVAGGGGLLGSKICRALGAAGAAVIVADQNDAAASGLAQELNELRPESAIGCEVDITVESSVQEMLDVSQQRWGKVDGFVNCSYPRNERYGAPVEKVTYSDFCENVSMHLGGFFLCLQRVGAQLATQKSGSIVNLASIYGSLPPRFEIYSDSSFTMPVEYAATKAAIIHLTKYFAKYYKSAGVRVNCLSPGGIEDGQPVSFIRAYEDHCGSIGMLGTEHIAGAVLFLLSDLSEAVTGQDLIVDDGFSL